MKRSAENQLTKDSADDDDIQEISGPGGDFKKADDATLARRPIKALPKRGLSATPVPSAPLPAFGQPSTSMNGDKSQFGGFGGFGTNTNSTFTFNASSSSIGSGISSTSTPPKAPNFNPLLPSSSVGAMQVIPSSTFSSPNPASSASSAASIFGSIVNNATKQNGTPSTTFPSFQQKDGKGDDDVAVKYYSSLRGLNVSLSSAIAKALEDDPFFDASTLLERYKALKQVVEKEFDTHREKSATGPPNGSKGSSAPLFGSTSTTPTLPVPPKGTTFSFGSSAPSSSSSDSAGFKPTGFTPSFFSTPPPGKSSTTSPFGAPASSSAPKPFSFPTSTSDSVAKTETTSSTSSPSGFSFSSKSTSIFGGASSSPFGASSVSTEKRVEGSAPSSSSFFGSTTSTSASSSSIFGKGTMSDPAGFTFGSPTPEPEGPPTPGLSASGSSSALMDTAIAPSSAGGDSTRGVTPATTDGGDMDDTPKVLGANPNDEEGPGEEDEETTHTSRAKVYKMTQQEGKPTWAEYGIGFVRLKKHKESGVRRMLCRNSATAKIMINFRLYKSLKATVTKQAISFIGQEDGKPASFRLRLKDEASANALKEAIDAEVARIPT